MRGYEDRCTILGDLVERVGGDTEDRALGKPLPITGAGGRIQRGPQNGILCPPSVFFYVVVSCRLFPKEVSCILSQTSYEVKL